MTGKPDAEWFEPTTLKEANRLLPRFMPAATAPPSEWLAFRRRAAATYERIADIDRHHHHEALYWAHLEGAAADELASKTDPTPRPVDPDSTDTLARHTTTPTTSSHTATPDSTTPITGHAKEARP